ncbi:MAG TPA: ATP-binding cassette domain-containing protein [Thermoanaerobaculia bacterium]|nr:ATP-binding cassette domain-containing protein [Thermoanaerobaculia bacterium]
MLDVALRGLSFTHRNSGFSVEIDSAQFEKSTHTAILGAAGSGVSTLLQLISGDLRPKSGEIVFGTRAVEKLSRSRRPLLQVGDALDVPSRWSVEHALIAAVRRRSLDRVDRQREVELAAEHWSLVDLRERSIASLSTGEQLRVHLARIELLKPALLIADRLHAGASASEVSALGDRIYRLLRSMGTTVIASPVHLDELRFADRAMVMDGGRIVQVGTPAAIYSAPASRNAASATGPVNAIPVRVAGGMVESIIGSWPSDGAFEGNGFALARPEDFEIARRGEDSDLVFAIEEASFSGGRWIARGILTGSFLLEVVLPGEETIHKGRLLPLRYDPRRFTLVPS